MADKTEETLGALLKHVMSEGVGLRHSASPNSPKWSVKALADHLNTDRKQIQRWLNDQNVISDVNFQLLLRKLLRSDAEREAFADRFKAARRATEVLRYGRKNTSPFHVVDLGKGENVNFLSNSGLLGREKEILYLTDFSGDRRSWYQCILGAPGIGKSALSMAILNHSNAIEIFGRNRFVFHADETSLSTVEELLQALCLPIFGKAMPNALLALEEMAASSEALVLLDNFESVWERERDVAEKFLRLLTETQGLAILMTIRGSELPRGVSWNKWVELPPLAPEQSEEFFRTIAPDVPKGDSNFDELLSDLDGLPLAIELLAERARFTPFDELFNRWQRHKLKLLSREPQLSRSDSLTLSISFTVAGPRITSSGFHLFAIMGRLPAGILVADCDKIFGEESIDMIYELRRTRLVFDEAERLKMLNPIREYALQLPVDEQRFERTRKYYFALLHLHGPAPGNLDIAGGIRRLTPEIGNVSRLMADNSDFADDELATEYIERFANFGRFSGISSIETLRLWQKMLDPSSV